MKTTNIFTIFFDLLFPPSENQQEIRSFSVEKLRKISPPGNTPDKFIESLFTYRHPSIRTLIFELKYQQNTQALNLCAELLSEEILYFLSEKQQYGSYTEPLLVPIPMHSSKKRERGWNQTELLAKAVSKIIQETTYAPLLVKTKDSMRQTEVRKREDRLKNVSGSFGVKKGKSVKSKDIILIDDVTTTGATLSEARSVLEKEGARSIHAFTVAH